MRWACFAIFFLALGLGEFCNWGRLEPAFGGNKRSRVPTAQSSRRDWRTGTGSFYSDACASACMNRHAREECPDFRVRAAREEEVFGVFLFLRFFFLLFPAEDEEDPHHAACLAAEGGLPAWTFALSLAISSFTFSCHSSSSYFSASDCWRRKERAASSTA